MQSRTVMVQENYEAQLLETQSSVRTKNVPQHMVSRVSLLFPHHDTCLNICFPHESLLHDPL